MVHGGSGNKKSVGNIQGEDTKERAVDEQWWRGDSSLRTVTAEEMIVEG